MTFDEQLTRAFESLGERLRDELTREFRQVTSELTERARLEREAAVAAAVTRAVDAEREAAAAASNRDRGPAQDDHEPVRSVDLDLSARLLDGVRSIDQAVSLTDILDALTNCAAREAARVALFLARQGELRGWRFIGFGPEFDNAATVVLSVSEGHTMAEAVRTKAVVVADTDGPLPAPPFAALPSGRESLAIPVAMSGEIIAVLYADQGTADDPDPKSSGSLTWPDSLELMARHSARCLEATTAIKAVRVLAERPGASEPRASHLENSARRGASPTRK